MESDYYPFGIMIPERSFSNSNYRFGFNGKENDNEVKGAGNQQDYGMRINDTRLGRFLSVDPIAKQYPELTPYQFASNTPISAIDRDGLECDGAIVIPDSRSLNVKISDWVMDLFGDDDSKKRAAVEAGIQNIPGVYGFNNLSRIANGEKLTSEEILYTVIDVTSVSYLPLSLESKVKPLNQPDLTKPSPPKTNLNVQTEKVVAQKSLPKVNQIPDNAFVVRGGENSVETIQKAISVHPSGVTGISVNSGVNTVEQLFIGIPHPRIGVTTVGEVRMAGGDVIRTSGKSANHATLTGLTAEKSSKLLKPSIPNPVKK